ncbi:hypothetical protein SAMN02744778_03454 [Pantoea sp. GL120224-02]|jgi:hypothetical protein|nr:hypothetical protein SAMN02744778_03454 [Pantoea sp. GL120224-02]
MATLHFLPTFRWVRTDVHKIRAGIHGFPQSLKLTKK